MEIFHVPSLLFFFYFILSVSPPVISTVQLSDPGHPHLGNASDQKALLGFISAITYDPFETLLSTWKPNVSFCQWTGVICSRRKQRVVSLNVSSMGLQGHDDAAERDKPYTIPFEPEVPWLDDDTIRALDKESLHTYIEKTRDAYFRLKAHLDKLARDKGKGIAHD